jgi:uncharacterized SAM-binding protein YcdF (DUF218 family)
MYRILVTLAQPFTFVFVGVLVLAILLWRSPRPARRRTFLGLSVLLGGLTLICLPLVGYLSLLSLEWAYPPRDEMPQDVDTIVVLSGALQVYDQTGQHFELATDTLYRCLQANKLYRRRGGCRILVTGGKVEPDRPGPALAVAMRDFLVELGVKPSDILVEDNSTSTHENAVESQKLLDKLGVTRIVLVTDATHMPRAARCFRRQGLEVIPAACNHHANYFQLKARDFLPSCSAAGDIETAAHEWLGLLWYWLNGRI